LLAEVDSWLAVAAADTLRDRPRHGPVADATAAAHQLHPAAGDVRLEATDGGGLTVIAATSPVGPGYHTYLCGLLDRMGEDLDIAWAGSGAAGDPTASHDTTGFLASRDRLDAERGHLLWLHRALLQAREARRRGASGIHLETPPGALFTPSGVLATVLGPRSEEWLDRAIADPRVASDVWPWVADAMDARYLVGRALTLLWLEVRWRPPTNEEEIVLDEILGLLRRAYPLEPGLPYPWAAWSELLALRDVIDPATHQLVERMLPTAGHEPPIGYRRAPVTIVHHGWALEVPGTFDEHRNDEEWSGGEARRSVTIAATETGRDGEPMTADDFLEAVAGHLGSDALEHEDGPVRGRARLSTETSSGIEVATVEGYSAVRGLGAVIRIVIEDPLDWKWALDTWRDLRPS
jgi:hypothetical protein